MPCVCLCMHLYACRQYKGSPLPFFWGLGKASLDTRPHPQPLCPAQNRRICVRKPLRHGREAHHLRHRGRDAAMHLPRGRTLRRDDGDHRALVGRGAACGLREDICSFSRGYGFGLGVRVRVTKPPSLSSHVLLVTLNILSRRRSAEVRRVHRHDAHFLRFFFHGGLRTSRSTAVSALFLQGIGYCEHEAGNFYLGLRTVVGILVVNQGSSNLLCPCVHCPDVMFYPKAVTFSRRPSRYSGGSTVVSGRGTNSPDHGRRAASSSGGLQVDVRRGSLHPRSGGDGEQSCGSGQGRARGRKCVLVERGIRRYRASVPFLCRTRNGAVEVFEHLLAGCDSTTSII